MCAFRSASRLIATDLDGTLLNSRKEVPAEFEEWVCAHPDIKTVIASGRQYYNQIFIIHVCVPFRILTGMAHICRFFAADNDHMAFLLLKALKDILEQLRD